MNYASMGSDNRTTTAEGWEGAALDSAKEQYAINRAFVKTHT